MKDREVKQSQSGGKFHWKGEGIRIGQKRVNMVDVFCIYV
jgi:hypothetical protein